MASRPPKAHPNRRAARTRVRSALTDNRKNARSPPPPQFTPLSIAYDRLLPLIRDLLDFKWPPPMRESPDQRNKSLRYDYHRDHGHETNHCQRLKFLVEKLILAGYLRRYLREPIHWVATAPTTDTAIAGIEHASGPRQAINFILGGSADSQYQTKKQRRKVLRTASVRARVNTVRAQENITAVQPVDDTISFPLINPAWVITLHNDALVLTVSITILMYTGSSLIQAVQSIYYISQPLSK